jgi:formyl-CoA transferase
VLKEVKMQNVVPRLSATPRSIEHVGPDLGEHNDDETYRRLGCPDRLDELRRSGVI